MERSLRTLSTLIYDFKKRRLAVCGRDFSFSVWIVFRVFTYCDLRRGFGVYPFAQETRGWTRPGTENDRMNVRGWKREQV